MPNAKQREAILKLYLDRQVQIPFCMPALLLCTVPTGVASKFLGLPAYQSCDVVTGEALGFGGTLVRFGR